ncbi:helicase-related protein [Spirochaeta isovalerica]|uniref:RNA helicase HrpA n=1 Tax=Spirochaeta isovalerica TaxID=150 RepID=A0A841R4Z5_9SPIO|nr:ATP-dependent RNA helicase [Spirochaeta isovalerica]MBB6480224.1 RNA helicase HrpA [Spirochaeta isovalerica]
MKPKDLPVYKQKDKILEALDQNQVIVVESPTGSGKTTQLPLILHEAGYTNYGVVGVTQPRRIAAVSVSEYIADQLGTKVPGIVGYKMRFEDETIFETKLKIMTDGILLQEMKTDPMLRKYSVMMVDEAHERSLNIDFILGLLKNVIANRPEFKVIISSATLNTSVFSEYFDGCPIVRIETHPYPVTVLYDPPASDDPEEMIGKIVSIVERNVQEKGDVLIFLQGEKMIKDTTAALMSSAVKRKLHIQQLYGRLGKEEQEKVFLKAPLGKTKVVVSTNIAETSVTIDGITVVIDSGLSKQNFYNPSTFTSSLVETQISQASANQRRGRAGRTQPGMCFRLYDKDSFKQRPLYTREEIYRTDLAEVVLRMAEIGIRDFYSFDFINPPGRKGIIGAVETLNLLDALNDDNSLSTIGEMMVKFPLMPRHARMIVEAIMVRPTVLREVIIAATFLSTNSPFLLPQGEELEARKAHHRFRREGGDFTSYLNLFEKYQESDRGEKFCERNYLDFRTMNDLINIENQLEEIVSDMGVPITDGGSVEDFLTTCAKGLIQFVCVRSGRGVYKSLTAEKIIIHPGSVMFRENPRYIVAGEIVKTSRTYARSVSPLEKNWIYKISPDLADNMVIQERGGSKARKELSKGKRDTTWEINIGSTVFKLVPDKSKNKKVAMMDWEKLHKALKPYPPDQLPDYGQLKGRLFYKGTELMTVTRISTILKAAKMINPAKDIINSFPRKNYRIDNNQHLEELSNQITDILKAVDGGKRKKKTLGFLTLMTDGQGTYWFKSGRQLNAALNESLASLELLADEVSEETDEVIWKRINKAYRWLDQWFME